MSFPVWLSSFPSHCRFCTQMFPLPSNNMEPAGPVSPVLPCSCLPGERSPSDFYSLREDVPTPSTPFTSSFTSLRLPNAGIHLRHWLHHTVLSVCSSYHALWAQGWHCCVSIQWGKAPKGTVLSCQPHPECCLTHLLTFLSDRSLFTYLSPHLPIGVQQWVAD